MTDLRKLAERCEAATGPDRELDAEIAVSTSTDVHAWVIHPTANSMFYHQPGWWRTSDDRSYCAPPFTASIDSAMTLVPEGRHWSLGWGAVPGAEKPMPFAGVAIGNDLFMAVGVSPALCLCSAALRARAAQEASNA